MATRASSRTLTSRASLINGWISEFESRLMGRKLGLRVVAGYTSTVVDAFGDAFPLNAAEKYGSGPAVTCRIRVPPAGQSATEDFLRLVLAHEVFHCFQFDIHAANVWTPLPFWIGEGTADWAALTVDPLDYEVGGGNLSTYIRSSSTPLFTRSYDAVGFWGHVQDVYGNLFARIPSIINAGSSVGAFQQAGADASAFLDTWGSSVFNRPIGGMPWPPPPVSAR